MTIQYIFGVGCVVLSVVAGVYMWLRKYEIDMRYRFTARSSAEYKKVREEADRWRTAYEEMRAKAEEYEAILRVQNLVYGKVRLSDIENLHGRKRVETPMETEKME